MEGAASHRGIALRESDLDVAALAVRKSAAREAEARERFKQAMQRTSDVAEQRAHSRHICGSARGGSQMADACDAYDSVERPGPCIRDGDNAAEDEGDLALGRPAGARLARLEKEVKQLASNSASQLQELRDAIELAEIERRRAETRYEAILEELQLSRTAQAEERQRWAEGEEAVEESLRTVRRRSAELERLVELRGGESDGSPGRLKQLAFHDGMGDTAGPRAGIPSAALSSMRCTADGVSEASWEETRQAVWLEAESEAQKQPVVQEDAARPEATRGEEMRADRACETLRRVLVRANVGQAAEVMLGRAKRHEAVSAPSSAATELNLEWIEKTEALLLEWVDAQREAQVRDATSGSPQ